MVVPLGDPIAVLTACLVIAVACFMFKARQPEGHYTIFIAETVACNMTMGLCLSFLIGSYCSFASHVPLWSA